MRKKIVLALSLVLLAAGFPTGALAGARIVTGALAVPTSSGGYAMCTVVNAAERDLQVNIEIKNAQGATLASVTDRSVFAGAHRVLSTSQGGQRVHCIVEVVRGSKRNARVTLNASNSSGTLAVSTTGY